MEYSEVEYFNNWTREKYIAWLDDRKYCRQESTIPLPWMNVIKIGKDELVLFYGESEDYFEIKVLINGEAVRLAKYKKGDK